MSRVKGERIIRLAARAHRTDTIVVSPEAPRFPTLVRDDAGQIVVCAPSTMRTADAIARSVSTSASAAFYSLASEIPTPGPYATGALNWARYVQLLTLLRDAGRDRSGVMLGRAAFASASPAESAYAIREQSDLAAGRVDCWRALIGYVPTAAYRAGYCLAVAAAAAK